MPGLDGAPRRWSVLPSEYSAITRTSLEGAPVPPGSAKVVAAAGADTGAFVAVAVPVEAGMPAEAIWAGRGPGASEGAAGLVPPRRLKI